MVTFLITGRDLNATKKYRKWLVETCFVDIERKVILCPGNPWSKKAEDKRWAITKPSPAALQCPASLSGCFRRG
jgi:hypothetical protein